MALTEAQKEFIHNFVSHPLFSQYGGLMTDLDGTIVQHQNGNFSIPPEVQAGLKILYQSNCPVILNTIRFPLSVIKTFAAVLYPLTQKPVPVISLNGSQWGYIAPGQEQEFIFTEVGAQPLKKTDVQICIADVRLLVEQQVPNMAVFYYPRDWTKGEIIWTPDANKVAELENSYQSASQVYSSSLALLEEQLHAEEISMVFLLVQKNQIAATFLQRNFKDFYTATGVNKLTGAHAFVNQLGRNLKQFLGAGDTPMDVFLQETGAVIKVGNLPMDFDCQATILPVETVPEIGEVFTQIAEACADTNPATR